MKQKSKRIKYRALVVGAGRIGFSLGQDKLREQPAAHARALAENRRITLAGAVDIDARKLAAWKKTYPDTATYVNLNEAMEREKPDIVVIAVPEETHATVAASVFSHRPRLVILEKPVAPNLQEADAIRRAAQRAGVPVSVNHERRFARDYTLARDLVAHGELGALDGVRARLWSGAPVWTREAKRTGACSLLHDGTHLVDTVRFLLGAELNSPIIDFVQPGRNDSIKRLFFHYSLKDKIMVEMELAGNKKVFDFEIELTGDRGRLYIGNGFLRLLRRAPSPFYSGFYSLKRDHKIERPPETGYFSLMVQNCLDFLDGRAPLASPLSEGLKTLTTLYRVVEALGRINHRCTQMGRRWATADDKRENAKNRKRRMEFNSFGK
jgi:predicted dehydrogenase